jgi:hypothetical protein
MRKADVSIRLGERAIQLNRSLTTIAHDGVEHRYDANSYLISAPRQPVDELREPLEAAGHRVVAVGDCVAPRKIHDAVHEGYNAALRV